VSKEELVFNLFFFLMHVNLEPLSLRLAWSAVEKDQRRNLLRNRKRERLVGLLRLLNHVHETLRPCLGYPDHVLLRTNGLEAAQLRALRY
jgi:hypothetical protein